ncbi:hypothetical protein [Longibaculum muris]|uniref:hypothetical protein n=1 Tax=Longibaculum muris TaxID=1796628 RepID=UPI0029420644|nr:hypothetical protein [Longibaculum muris]
MGIWIRSQDKDDLFYAKIVEICKRKNDYAVLLNGIEKGRYSSKEKVIKVIDMINEKIETNEAIKIIGNIGLNYLESNGIHYNFVFQMPQDDEVKV